MVKGLGFRVLGFKDADFSVEGLGLGWRFRV